MYRMGCYEISLGDTIGIGTPQSVTNMIKVKSISVKRYLGSILVRDPYQRLRGPLITLTFNDLNLLQNTFKLYFFLKRLFLSVFQLNILLSTATIHTDKQLLIYLRHYRYEATFSKV